MFICLMFVVSMSLAACAAFFSVKGIGLLFAGSFLSVVIMASCLEAGKLMAASFLYRSWGKLTWWIKLYLTSATVLLMVITSMGIYGFLSDSYEQTKTRVNMLDNTIDRFTQENLMLNNQINEVKQADQMSRARDDGSIIKYKSIYDDFVRGQQSQKSVVMDRLSILDNDLQQIKDKPGGLFSSKSGDLKKLVESQSVEREELKQQLQVLNDETQRQYEMFLNKVDSINTDNKQQTSIADQLQPIYDKIEQNQHKMSQARIDISKTDIGSFRFVARSFDVETDTAVKWFILMIVLVFDPLAVCMIIGYNELLSSTGEKTTVKFFDRWKSGWFNRGKSVIEKDVTGNIQIKHRPGK